MNNELYDKLAQIQWMLHRYKIRNRSQVSPLSDPTRGQGRILTYLQLNDGISTKDLASVLGMAVSSLKQMLSKLQNAGFVIREPSRDDRRVLLVMLTEKGRSEVQPENPDMGDPFLDLSGDEQIILNEYLDRIIATMKRRYGEVGDDTFVRQNETLEKYPGLVAGLNALAEKMKEFS